MHVRLSDLVGPRFHDLLAGSDTALALTRLPPIPAYVLGWRQASREGNVHTRCSYASHAGVAQAVSVTALALARAQPIP
eukprot:3530700-Pyramimonas_sp.AAC.1